MTKLQVKTVVILAVLVASGYFLYPTIKWYSMKPEERQRSEQVRDKIVTKKLNLGLDLRGGTHLVLELDTAKLDPKVDISDAVNRAIEIIRNRVDQFGVSEPLIVRQGEKWIAVQLPGVKNPELAKELIGKMALLEFRLVDNSEAIDKITQKMREKGLKPREYNNTEILGMVPTGYIILPGREEDRIYIVKSTPEITGAHLVNAKVEIGGEFGLPHVSLEFDKEGAKIFSRVTEANIERKLSIVLDNIVQSAPVIRTRIPDGRAIIEGNFSAEEAKFLATVLRAGALPSPVKIIEERTVGPSLGEDSIRKGIRAGIIGSILVIIFMLLYYSFSGLIADIALLLNLVILPAALAAMHWTLTLPGLAGIILIVGMAIDSNVLILERIRDELLAGKTLRVAIDLGYDKALSAIVDGNLTTLIAAVFLFQFGTGPVKGFGVTLSLGIIISMFTAIFVTRTIYDWLSTKGFIDRIKII